MRSKKKKEEKRRKKKRILKKITKINRRIKEIEDLQRELKNLEDNRGEIYLLLIGDVGGGTFKLLLQDLTQVKPNSPFSGYLVGEMDAVDSHDNLEAGFGHMQVRRRIHEFKCSKK